MTDEAFHGIAEDAAHLPDALKDLEFNVPFCEATLVAAMPAIVAANVRPVKP